ncbi:MAG: TetR/AcrR family transcriptional regulator [Actinocrinis sp.]
MAGTGPRAPRADALRNRERLLEAAVRAFSQDGEVTLEAIAKQAGVGIGTLYRHFPSREALVEAAYRDQLDRLVDPVPRLIDALPADEALRTWMDRFADYMTTKRDMGDALRKVIASGANPYSHSREKLLGAVKLLLDAAGRAGSVRTDLDAMDILSSMSGLTLAAGEPRQREQLGRMLDLLMDGLRLR